MNSNMCDLSAKSCTRIESGSVPLGQAEIDRLLSCLEGWEQSGSEIVKTFRFSNYYETLAFVNAGAWISHREDHHPDLLVSYNRCCARYTTHDAGGLSLNDFICAAKMDRLQRS
jgi:4a-hydroxytetrahydrobiopterin dehydratase